MMPNEPREEGMPGMRVDGFGGGRIYYYANVMEETSSYGVNVKDRVVNKLAKNRLSGRIGVYVVQYSDMQRDVPAEADSETILSEYRDAYHKPQENEYPCTRKIVMEEDISYGPHPGKEIISEDFYGSDTKADFLNREKIYLVGKRIYVLTVSGPKQTSIVEPTCEDAETFFDSFELMN